MTDVIKNLKANQVLMIMDWAMNFLPASFRETQRDWFGKKGKSWHVCVAVSKNENGENKVNHAAWYSFHSFCFKSSLVSKNNTLRTVFKKSELPDLLFLLVFPYVWSSLILILFLIVLVYYCITAANDCSLKNLTQDVKSCFLDLSFKTNHDVFIPRQEVISMC